MSDQTATVTIQYDRAGKLYYVSDFQFFRPTTWLSVEKDADGKYATYPFAFYEIKGGREEQVPVDHELVRLYAECEGWPAAGTSEYLARLKRYDESMHESRDSHRKSMEYYDRQIAMCTRLLQAHVERGSVPTLIHSAPCSINDTSEKA